MMEEQLTNKQKAFKNLLLVLGCGRNGKYRLGDKEKVDMFIDLLGSKVSQLQTKVLQSYGIEPNEEIYQQQSTRD